MRRGSRDVCRAIQLAADFRAWLCRTYNSVGVLVPCSSFECCCFGPWWVSGSVI